MSFKYEILVKRQILGKLYHPGDTIVLGQPLEKLGAGWEKYLRPLYKTSGEALPV